RGAASPATRGGCNRESGLLSAPGGARPADLRPGEVLAVPCTGAYHHGLASTYSTVGRPPIVAVADGRATQLLRRETTADLLMRELAE
ncbi:diaminopimelate decarboxylase, partial [Nocardia sp. NPDC058497]